MKFAWNRQPVFDMVHVYNDLKISLPFSYEEMVNYAGNYPYFSVTDWKCAQFKIYPTFILVSKFLILFFKRMAPDLC